jgi:hypothetical protein
MRPGPDEGELSAEEIANAAAETFPLGRITLKPLKQCGVLWIDHAFVHAHRASGFDRLVLYETLGKTRAKPEPITHRLRHGLES